MLAGYTCRNKVCSPYETLIKTLDMINSRYNELFTVPPEGLYNQTSNLCRFSIFVFSIEYLSAPFLIENLQGTENILSSPVIQIFTLFWFNICKIWLTLKTLLDKSGTYNMIFFILWREWGRSSGRKMSGNTRRGGSIVKAFWSDWDTYWFAPV